jgi:hypothetical protein
LIIELVNHPTKIEWLHFSEGGKVTVNWGRHWKTKKDWGSVTTNPWLDWRFVDGRVVIFDGGHVAEELSLLRREGSFLILRMKSGEVGRFKILHEGSNHALQPTAPLRYAFDVDLS